MSRRFINSTAAIDAFFDNVCFFQQFLRNPRKTGAICPSGRHLSGALARAALGNRRKSPGLIVDLGAGAGAVSRELLNIGIPPERILPVDISPVFKSVFRKHCSGMELRIGDARDLRFLIDAYAPDLPVQAIVSSLPLKSLPGTMVAEIMAEIRGALLERGGFLVQFTYAVWTRSKLAAHGFRADGRQFVGINLPPAIVEIYSPER